MLAVLKAHGWHLAIPVAFLLALLGAFYGAVQLRNPFTSLGFPLRTIVTIAIAVALTHPLLPNFDELATTLPREATIGLLRYPISLALFAAACGVNTSVKSEPLDLVFAFLLFSVAILATRFLDSYAWLVTIVVGFAYIVLLSTPSAMTSSVLYSVSLRTSAGLAVSTTALAAFVTWHRSSRLTH